MPLSAAFPTLIKDIEAAFEKKIKAMESMKEFSKEEKAKILQEFYIELATAIHSYTMSAQVVTTTTGVVVGTAAPLAPTGAAPVFGSSTGAGNGNLV